MKLFLIFVLSFVVVTQRCHSSPAKNVSMNDYLIKYGYMFAQADGGTPPEPVYRKALETFQHYAGLLVTGKLDSATVSKLTGPRCGAKDVKQSPISRRKRFVKQGTTWKKMDLTYSIHVPMPSQKISPSTVRRTLTKTFKLWQDASQLTFRSLAENDPNADIIIRFGSGQHGDPYPFDNTGGTLAHGFYPLSNTGLSGDVHFDDDEVWTVNGQVGTTDYTWTALHEIGHAIGLDHARDSAAIMWPWFEAFKPNLKLNQDDIHGIQSIYGLPKGQTKPPKPDICREYKFDAVMYYPRTRNTYFFKGNKVWVMNERRNAGNHEIISDKWPGLEGYLDAAYTRKDGDIIFFKGNRFWRYRGYVKIEGPKALSSYITNLPGSMLNKIEAVMIWKPNGKTYFFKGLSYWRYDEENRILERGYPRSIRVWDRVKIPVDAVMTWKNGKTFFFYNDKIYPFGNKAFAAKVKTNQNKQKINYFIKNCRK